MLVKKKIAIFACLFNLVPLLNTLAMDKDDKVNLMQKVLPSEAKLCGSCNTGCYSDSIDIFKCGDSKYILKILDDDELNEKNVCDFFSNNEELASMAKKNNIYYPLFAGKFTSSNDQKVYPYVIYEYAGKDERNFKELSEKQKIELWNRIVKQKTSALLMLYKRCKILHLDPTYKNWVIYNGKVNLIDFGLVIINLNEGSIPIHYEKTGLGTRKKFAVPMTLENLLNSFEYDLCDILSISHEKKDDAEYNDKYEKVRDNLDELIDELNKTNPPKSVEGFCVFLKKIRKALMIKI